MNQEKENEKTIIQNCKIIPVEGMSYYLCATHTNTVSFFFLHFNFNFNNPFGNSPFSYMCFDIYYCLLLAKQQKWQYTVNKQIVSSKCLKTKHND